MGTFEEKLNKTLQTKGEIKQAIISKGVSVPDNIPFDEYPSKIMAISGGSVQDLGWFGFRALEDGVTIRILASSASAPTPNLYSSLDGMTWTSFSRGATTITLQRGELVFFRGTNSTFASSDDDYNRFVIEGYVASQGNIMSLLDPDMELMTVPDYCFRALFNGCKTLVLPPELPATTMGKDCYYGLFYGCTSLLVPPSLPATTLAEGCYHAMFYGCTYLSKLPKLPALTLAKDCYYGMFYNCKNIKLSSSSSSTYNESYRIPYSGTGTTATDAMSYMFTGTGGTMVSNPVINTTYYTTGSSVLTMLMGSQANQEIYEE